MDMLQITKSKLREELLNLYFTNPNKRFYLRELERILGFSVGNIRRELIKLKKRPFSYRKQRESHLLLSK